MEWQTLHPNLTENQWTTFISFKITFVILTNIASLMFLIINAVIVHTLRSRQAFRETPRYALLLNLVVADSIVIFMGQFMYMQSGFYLFLSYPLCGFYTMISYLSVQISPLTLMVMSIERYIAVCFPFRHATMVTTRNTAFAILIVWVLGCVDILFRVLLLLEFPFHKLPSLQMNFYCVSTTLLLGPRSSDYEMASVTVLFMLSGLVILSSFIGVMMVALSASTDKASADKARNTLLLHMFQLCLNLLSIMGLPIINRVAALTDKVLLGQLLVLVYIFVVMMPRCLSALTYSLKDPSIRPVLVSHLCCHLKHNSPVVTSL